MRKLIRRQKQKQRSGAMLVLIAIMFPVFLAMLVFTVDIAYMQMVRTELRAAVDAAAKAGVEALARTQNKDEATNAAIDIAGRNVVAGKGLLLTPEDVEFGRAVQQKNGSWQFEANTAPYNSLRVRAEMVEGSTNGAVPLLFGHMLGYDRFQPVQKSTAAFQENDLLLVVDRSGSMCYDLSGKNSVYPPSIPKWPSPLVYPPHPTESRWSALNKAVQVFLTELQKSNSSTHVSLVSFGSKIDSSSGSMWTYTHRKFDATTLEVKLGSNFDPIRWRMNALGSDIMIGRTHLSAGMEEGIKELTGKRSRPLSAKIMVVMTDGIWNEGKAPKTIAAIAKSKDITIHTVTLLPNVDEVEMREVAQMTGGKHYHANSEAELTEIFAEIARSVPVILVD